MQCPNSVTEFDKSELIEVIVENYIWRMTEQSVERCFGKHGDWCDMVSSD